MADWDDFATYRPLLEASRVGRHPDAQAVIVEAVVTSGSMSWSLTDLVAGRPDWSADRPHAFREAAEALRESLTGPDGIAFLGWSEPDGSATVKVWGEGRAVGVDALSEAPELRIRGRRVRPKTLMEGRFQPPQFAHIGPHTLPDVAASVHPDLEALEVASPSDLALLAGHPRLRSLRVHPGKVSDVRQVLDLPALEHLMLGMAEWRTLLDGGTLPPLLQTAQVDWSREDPRAALALSDEILAAYGKEPLAFPTLEGRLSADAPATVPATVPATLPAAERARRRWFRRG